jgi:hypothetical protein
MLSLVPKGKDNFEKDQQWSNSSVAIISKVLALQC